MIRNSIVWAVLTISARWAFGAIRQAYLSLGSVGGFYTVEGVANVEDILDDDEERRVPLATRRHLK